MALMLERTCSNFVFSSLVSPCWQNVLIYTETLPWLQNVSLNFFCYFCHFNDGFGQTVKVQQTMMHAETKWYFKGIFNLMPPGIEITFE